MLEVDFLSFAKGDHEKFLFLKGFCEIMQMRPGHEEKRSPVLKNTLLLIAML